MSQRHVGELESVYAEYRTVLQLLQDESKRLRKSKAAPKLQATVDDALANLSDTYFLRLAAAFESVLRRHLIEHYPTLPIGRRDGLFSLVVKARKRIDPA